MRQPLTLMLVACLILSACGPTLPHPECAPASSGQSASLQCDAAVRAALDALPDDHATITRIQFAYGSVRPNDCASLPVAIPPRVCGYVVFTFNDVSRRYVAVTQQDNQLFAASPRAY